MATQRIFSSRTKRSASTFIGNPGLIFYDEVDGELRLSDGVTPGGVAISVRADLITAQRLNPGADNNIAYGLGDETHRWYDLHIGDGGIKFDGYPNRPQTVPYRPGAQVDDIIPALDNDINLGSTSTRFANLYLGYQGLFLADETTDENINITVDQGTLYIDGAENLRLGNLAIRDTTLTSANSTLDISIGNAGDTGFFYVKRKAQIDNTTFSATESMLSINASGGAEPVTLFPDTLIQTTGRPNKNSRIVQRSYGSSGVVGGDNAYAVWASYAARGTVAAPAALKQNDILARISANGYGTATFGSGGARVEFVALENFTDSAKGTRINFWTVPLGQVASQNVASINSVGIVAKGIEFSNDSTIQTTAGIPLAAKAVSSATYVATLGIDGKLDASQIPSSLSGAIVFKGVWNAATNTPALSDTTPAGLQSGWEYIVETGGTRDIGDGSKTFLAGDFVIYDGTHWKQVPSGNTFISLTGGGGITVNQSTGAIVLGSSATPNATTSTIVSRNAIGNFSANVITANLTGNVTGNVSGSAGSVTGNAATASKLFAATTINGVSFDGSAPVTVHTAGTGISINGTTVTNIGVVGTGTLMTNAVNATTATNAAYAYSFNTGTLVANAVSATTSNYATTSGYALSFNTGTLVTSAVNATNAVNATTATLARTATTATNLTVATSILAGKLSAATGSVAKNSVATVTYTITGLTTNHKIVITPGTVMPDRQFSVTAAWASAADTISIQYANNSGGAISVTFDINYFAFV